MCVSKKFGLCVRDETGAIAVLMVAILTQMKWILKGPTSKALSNAMLLVFHSSSLSLAIDGQHFYVITVQLFYSIHFHLYFYQEFPAACDDSMLFQMSGVEPCSWKGLMLKPTEDSEEAPLTSCVFLPAAPFRRMCLDSVPSRGRPSGAGT